MVLPRSCDSDGKIWACSPLLNSNVPTCVRSPLLEKPNPSEFKCTYFQDECRCGRTASSLVPRADPGALGSEGRARLSLPPGHPQKYTVQTLLQAFKDFLKLVSGQECTQFHILILLLCCCCFLISTIIKLFMERLDLL